MKQRTATPLITVAIICYNYGKYIKESVESVKQQTYKNIETIIINDGSTDNTDAEVKKLLSKYPEIKYHKQENMGVVRTRNKAIELAKGDYLLQVDADDYIDSNYVEEFINKALETKADIVYGDYEMFEGSSEKSNFPDFDFELLKNRNYINVSSLVKVSAIGNTRFDIKLNKLSHEDWDFFLGLCSAGKVATKCSTSVLHYRIHNNARNNQTSNISDQRKYIDMYSYVIDKYSKKYPDKYSYLIGGTFAHWYQELDNNNLRFKDEIKLLQQDIQYQKNETIQIRHELTEIKNSKIYKQIERLRTIKHKLTKH